MAFRFSRGITLLYKECLNNFGRSALRKSNLHTTRTAYLWGKEEGPTKVEDDRDRVIGPGTDIKEVVIASQAFDAKDKDKDNFLATVEDYSKTITKHRHGQVEFIYGALRIMKDYGVHRDLEAYKALMDVFPKERMKPQNVMQYGFFHYGKQQICAVTLLDEMEYNSVIPDAEMEQLVISIFSKHSTVWRKVARQLYWFSKFKNANPFPMPENLPNDAMELAKIALKRMCIDLQTKIGVFATGYIDASLDKTWIVSAQSPSQQELIAELKPMTPLYVEGSFRVWLQDKQISYFILRADNPRQLYPEEDDKLKDDDPFDVSEIPINIYGRPKNKALMEQKSIHEQDDGINLGICATGTSSRDSLLSWIRTLERTNPNLAHMQVIFTLKAPTSSVATVNEPVSEKDKSTDVNDTSEQSAESKDPEAPKP